MGKYNICCLVIIVVHVLVALVIALALMTRFEIYKPIYHNDMPSDLRIVDRKASTMFCNGFKVEAGLDVDNPDTKAWSNSEAMFDVYTSDTNPKDNITTFTKKITLNGISSLYPAQSRRHSFHSLRGSNISMFICTKYEHDGPKPALYVYVIKGFENYTKWENLVSNPDTTDCPSSICFQKEQVNTSGDCDKKGISDYSNIKLIVSETATYYMVVFYPKTSTNTNFMKYRMIYNLNRTQYALTEYGKPHSVFRNTARVPPSRYVVLDFKYFHNDSENSLYNIKITFSCDSNIIMYTVFFFWIPLAVVVALAIITICYLQKKKRDDSRSLLDTSQGYGYQESYGAVHT